MAIRTSDQRRQWTFSGSSFAQRVLVVTNMYPTKARPHEGTFVRQQVLGLERTGIQLDVLHIDRADGGRRVYLTLRDEFCRRLDNFRPDVIHVMYGGVMAGLVVRLAKSTPVIVSFCGSDLLGTVDRTPSTYARNWINLRASHRAARCAAGIIVKSQNLRNALPRDVRESRLVEIIPNGVNLESFHPIPTEACLERLHWEPREFHVVFCRHGDPVRKRQWLAEAAVAKVTVSKRHARLHIMDEISHEEVPYWLCAADALLVTSVHEGSINIVKEALACDLPIVSVDVGDVAERIAGVEGCYLAKANSTDLACKLEVVAERGTRVSGRAAVAGLTIEHIAERIRRFYVKALSMNESRRVRM